MPNLTELTRANTNLNHEQTAHLLRLVSEWGMLADLSFADLLLYVPTVNSEPAQTGGDWLVIAQVRSATSQTMYPSDFVGAPATRPQAELLQRAYTSGEIVEGSVPHVEENEDIRVRAVPVVSDGATIAVMTKEWIEWAGRRPGGLERIYGETFDRFTDMIAAGRFPFPARVADSSSAPRVGDGTMLLNADAEVIFASPNANSAMHRVGIQPSAVGMRLSELGFNDRPVRQAFERQMPVIEEFDQGPDVTLLARCVPTLDDDGVSGALLLMRDVTELRKRDRLLLTKDATIREIHHRVKNNLQTISSLLRLQARRLTNPEAISAVAESVRRIRTIALVHEALSREPGEDVTFIEIARPLLRLAEEGLQSPDRPVRFEVSGDGGRIPAAIATPLSVVLTELLQNAVDHAFPEGSAGGTVNVALHSDADELQITVIDDGRGVESGFDLDSVTGLGLSIVRTLVTTELNGEIEMRPRTASDVAAGGPESEQPVRGTVVSLRVPTNLD